MTLETSQLAPGLLLAMPQLVDPHFARSVVLMVEHGDEGSFGLVINQPSDVRASTLLSSLDMQWRGGADARVWAGGPVAPSTGWVLHEPIALAGGGTVEIAPGIALSTSPDRLRRIGAAPPGRIRLLLGCAGWGPGQLTAEMARGAWMHAAADPDLVFDTPAEQMWEAALRSVGASPDRLGQTSGVN
ncbi:MAG: YqgE/AlgH family protein [Kofleriaceae bacterium]